MYSFILIISNCAEIIRFILSLSSTYCNHIIATYIDALNHHDTQLNEEKLISVQFVEKCSCSKKKKTVYFQRKKAFLKSIFLKV